ncbi:hypothetical protein [Roseateles saccharophilus]|uniref:Uncharacterized protein n=1 Tax=Roseateles saccharophilus TaxID=304 RepID=A0A4R3UAC3_ROSSA|nr:hypothetical protein [Roseateles saccharophilus]MDG0835800.1 hypothetical protein [Roseateles saccharophilus]TCU83752.1 hypothetical protein EV671_105616 [Roseateles saccharophilus]
MAKSIATRRKAEPPKPRAAASVAGKAKAAAVKVTRHKPLSRARLVGKFPEIRHLPAPTAPHQIKDDDRRKLLSAMALV